MSDAAGAPQNVAPSPRVSTVAEYEDWFASVFHRRVAAPGVRIAASWPDEDPWGQRAHSALVQVECEYVAMLLEEIRDRKIPGDIAEFGIYQGWWINFFWEQTERLHLPRRIYGFDSFEGLSQPDSARDLHCWEKGQYACSFDAVARNVFLASRPRINLVKGFFEKSLRGADALLADQFCYARIDCDIYEPARDCLRYLSHRLADGAILVFDDWPHMLGYGEQLAFEEWLPSVPHLDFEFLFYNTIGHFYLRVHHKKS